MSAFYPGAGTDLAPPVLFPDIKTWWYMDGQPRSEFGYVVGCYREKFIDNLNQTMNQCGFDLQSVHGDLRTYYSSSTDQTIYYETNTVFPDGWDPIRHKGDTLVLCGYDINGEGENHPGFFSSYSHIITNDHTCDSVWDCHPHSVSMMCFKEEWPYWLIEEETKENFLAYVTIQHNIK